MSAPERIMVGVTSYNEFPTQVEYVRADATHTDADMERAVRAALEAAAGACGKERDKSRENGWAAESLGAARAAQRIRNLDPAEIVRAAREGGE